MRASGFTCFLLLSLAARAQVPEEITEIREAMQKQEIRIAGERDATRTKHLGWYRDELTRIGRGLRAGGNDAELQQVNREAARFDKQRNIPDPSPDALPGAVKNAQSGFRNKASAAERAALRSRLKLMESYVKRITSLQQQLTIANRIEDAKAARDEAVRARDRYAKTRVQYKAMPRPEKTSPVPGPSAIGVAPLHSALRNGLELYLSFNEEPAERVRDESGNERHGTAANAGWTAKGKSGGALRLDGRGGVTVPHNLAMNMPRHFTLSAWFNLAQASSKHPAPQLLISKESVTRLGGWWFSFSGQAAPAGALVFRMYRTDARIESRWDGAADLLPGRWYHAAAVFDGEHMITYLDGREQRKTRWGFPTTGSLNPVRVGFGLQGMIDEVMVHSRALSKTDISMLYRAKR